jgi:hypothetical protein
MDQFFLHPHQLCLFNLKVVSELLRISDSPINDQLVVHSRLVAHRTRPCGLPLVHLYVEYGIEALQVCAGGGPTGQRHPHLAQRTQQRHTQTRRRYLTVHVLPQLLLDCGHNKKLLTYPNIV